MWIFYTLVALIKSFFCKHDLKFVRNIYGDEIIMSGYKRSIWFCSKCKTYIYKDELRVVIRIGHQSYSFPNQMVVVYSFTEAVAELMSRGFCEDNATAILDKVLSLPHGYVCGQLPNSMLVEVSNLTYDTHYKGT